MIHIISLVYQTEELPHCFLYLIFIYLTIKNRLKRKYKSKNLKIYAIIASEKYKINKTPIINSLEMFFNWEILRVCNNS